MRRDSCSRNKGENKLGMVRVDAEWYPDIKFDVSIPGILVYQAWISLL